VLVVVATVLATAGPLYAADEAEIDRARESVLDVDYQPRMPDEAVARAPVAERRDDVRDDAERERLDTRLRAPAGRSSVMTFVMWGLVIVVGGVLAVWLASGLFRSTADPELPADARPRGAASAILARPLDDADELARGGAFAAAIHTLLLRTLLELARGADVGVAPAMTSREILARVPLRADARAALAGLIGAVELTHFGDAPATATDYGRCRDQFHVFAHAFREAAA